MSKPDFIIDEPYHKRWWLPDGKHQYNSVLYGSFFHLSIIDALTGEISHCFNVEIKSDDSHKNLLEYHLELANKYFPKVPRMEPTIRKQLREGFR